MPDPLDLLHIASDERRHVQFTPDEAKWLLDRLAAATAEVERLRGMRGLLSEDLKRTQSALDIAQTELAAETERADKAEAAVRDAVFRAIQTYDREHEGPPGRARELLLGLICTCGRTGAPTSHATDCPLWQAWRDAYITACASALGEVTG